MRKLDHIDRKILSILQKNAKVSMQDLSEAGGLSASPCLRRVKLMEEAGIIRGYVALVEQKSVGLPISVFASVKLERQRESELDRFAAAITAWPEVVECYLMTGHRDFLLRIVVPDLEAYDRFLKARLTRLEGVASIESSFALEQTKYTNVLPIP